MVVTAYSDTDWTGNMDDRTSTGAYMVFLGITQYPGAQESNVLSLVLQLKQSTRALVATTFEIGRLSPLFRELSPLILCDNIGATQLSLNLAYHSRMKHVTIDLYFVREYVAKGLRMFIIS